MTAETEPKERFLEQLEQFDRSAAAEKYRPLRQAARGRFRALSFPTPRTEDWRFTSVAPLLGERFELPAPAPAGAAALPAPAAPDALRLVFVNGRFAPEHARLDDVPAGVAV